MTEYRSCTFLGAISAARNAAGSLRYAQGFQRLGRSYFSSSFIRPMEGARSVPGTGPKGRPVSFILAEGYTPARLSASFGHLSSSLVVLYLPLPRYGCTCVSPETRRLKLSGQRCRFRLMEFISDYFRALLVRVQLAASRSMDRRRIYHRGLTRERR